MQIGGRSLLLSLAAFFPGCAASGEELAGPAADPSCDDPVYLMVVIDDLDRTKSAAYGQALRETRIVAKNGGEYLLVGKPLSVIEGDWPSTRNMLVERYPCKAAFEHMWYSDLYQNELIPLRAGSGNYRVLLFDSWPPTDAGAAPSRDAVTNSAAGALRKEPSKNAD